MQGDTRAARGRLASTRNACDRRRLGGPGYRGVAMGLRGAADALFAWTAARLAEERERWILWLPVCLGGGIGLYFALPREPAAWSGPLCLAALALLLLPHRRRALRLPLIGLMAIAAGFCLAQFRAAEVAAPLLTKRVGPTEIVGLLEEIEPRGGARRLTLRPLTVEDLAPGELPRRVRLRHAGSFDPGILPGSEVRLLAVLLPPPAPAIPGGYDFGRDAFFRGLGAVGFVLGAVELEASGRQSGWTLWWSRQRDALGAAAGRVLEGDTAGVAQALLTGERGAISEATAQAYRDSGLAHLLAISGLHVGLIAALLFFTLRAGLAAVPALALRQPIKKWAAGAAMVALPPYLWLVGGSVPTQRATLMALVVLLAVLLDRRAISLRLVAWAAVVVLALTPEALLGPSFQMSFAAVTALVAAYEHWRGRGPRQAEDWPERLRLYLGGVLLSSLIAGLATAPFAAYHFERLALYGLAGNLAAVPLTAFWIMPCCLLVYLLWPFGAAEPALWLLGVGVASLNEVATTVAAWPAAALLVPAMPLWGLAAIALGGLWLCLWSRRWRLASLPLILAGALSPLTLRPPDLLIDGETRVLAAADPAGELWLSTRRAGRFASDVWLARRAQRAVLTWGELWERTPDWFACDSLGCLYRRSGREVALVFQGTALIEDCWGNDLVIALLPLGRACPRGTVALDRFDLWREGTWAIWVEPDGVRFESVAEGRGERPWSPARTGEAVSLPDGWEGWEE